MIVRQISKRAPVPLAQVELPDDRPWQRLPGERARDEFEAWLAMGPTRTLAEIARLTGRPPGTVRTWSSRYCWLERAAAYDIHYAEHAGLALRNLRDPINVEVVTAVHAQVKRVLGAVAGQDFTTLDLDRQIAALVSLDGVLDKHLNPRQSGGGAGTTVNVAVTTGAVDSRLEAFTERLRIGLDRAGLTPEQWSILEAAMRDPA